LIEPENERPMIEEVTPLSFPKPAFFLDEEKDKD
jgi:hypothetical protein